MERTREVRYLRFSQIDQIQDLSPAVRHELKIKMAAARRDSAELINFEKIKAGDNDEWKFLLDTYKDRFRRYCSNITLVDRFTDDIVSNAIADAYISRNIMNSADHLIGHIFQFIRYESFNWMVKGPGKFVLDDNIIAKIEWFMSDHREDDMETMLEKEKWKDEMLNLLRQESRRLPPRWRDFATMHFTYRTRSEYWQWIKNDDTHSHTRNSTFEALAKMVKFRLWNKSSRPGNQIEEIKLLIRGMSKYKRSFFRAMRGIERLGELCTVMKVQRGTAKRYISDFVVALRKIYYDPVLDFHHSSSCIRFLNTISDPEVAELFEQELFCPPDTNEYTYGKRRNGFTKEEMREIKLLRDERKLSWRKIAHVIHSDSQTAKKAYEQYTGTGAAPRLSPQGVNHMARLTVDQVIEIRKKYTNEKCPVPVLAKEYHLSEGAMWKVVRGDTWGFVPGGSAKKAS